MTKKRTRDFVSLKDLTYNFFVSIEVVKFCVKICEVEKISISIFWPVLLAQSTCFLLIKLLVKERTVSGPIDV